MKLRKILSLILFSSLTLGLFASCSPSEVIETSSTSDQASGTSEQNSTEESVVDFVKDYPVITGSFIQYNAFLDYTETQLTKHFDYLQEAGINTIVLFISAYQDVDGNFNTVYYPSSLAAENKGSAYDASNSDMTERMLDQCKNHGMKAYISPNYCDEGWNEKNLADENWYKQFSEDSVKIANEMYSLFKEKYGDTFYGWYFVPEFVNYFVDFTDVQLDRAAEMLNIYIDGINALDPSMPFLMSPYFVDYAPYATAKETAAVFDTLFAKVHFRKGDIFCPQDCVGSGFLNAQTFAEYYKELKTVIDKYENLALWGNPESFKQTNWSSAPMTRFVYQLETAEPYVEGFISFAYSHYYTPDVVGVSTFHDAYVKYYETGEVDYYTESEEIIPISFSASNSASGVELSASFNNCKYGVSYVEFYRGTELVATAHTEMENYGDDTITLSAIDKTVSTNTEYTYTAIAYDYILHPSEEQTTSVNVTVSECISIGKSYTTDYTGNANYPDDGIRLTDGKYATTEDYSDTAASGFADSSTVSFIIDLGESTQISSVLARALSSGSGGAIVSSNVEVSFSDDGISFSNAVSVDATAFPLENGYSNVSIPVTNITARYVKVSYVSLRNWLFIDEISVYR